VDPAIFDDLYGNKSESCDKCTVDLPTVNKAWKSEKRKLQGIRLALIATQFTAEQSTWKRVAKFARLIECSKQSKAWSVGHACHFFLSKKRLVYHERD
jgi:hypothetical protein